MRFLALVVGVLCLAACVALLAYEHLGLAIAAAIISAWSLDVYVGMVQAQIIETLRKKREEE